MKCFNTRLLNVVFQIKSFLHIVIFATAAVLLLTYRWQPTTIYQEEEEEETLSMSPENV